MKNYLFLILMLGALTSCDKFPLPLLCGTPIIINSELFQEAPNDAFRFSNAQIDGDCLELIIQYGGGCGDVELKLIGAEEVAESFPPQRAIRLSLEDNDFCEALVTDTLRYDLKLARVFGVNEVFLNLEGWNEPILYTY